MEMIDKNACSRIETLFISYKTLLERHGLGWLSDDNGEISVYHVLSKIYLESLRSRLKSHLELS